MQTFFSTERRHYRDGIPANSFARSTVSGFGRAHSPPLLRRLAPIRFEKGLRKTLKKDGTWRERPTPFANLAGTRDRNFASRIAARKF